MRHIRVLPLFGALLLVPEGRAIAQPAPLTTEQITERMAQRNLERNAEMQDYTVTRRYRLDNKRFNKHAEMLVRMSYTPSGAKQFEVLSETGSRTVRKRVFQKMIEAEMEAAQESSRRQTQITPENYQFRLVGADIRDGRASYQCDVRPRTKNKFLLEGRIWVDAEDFAISRIEGKPAVTPSFWTRKVYFVHRYEKFGPFWLAVSNQTETDVLVFGSTELTIEYFDYRINRQVQKDRG